MSRVSRIDSHFALFVDAGSGLVADTAGLQYYSGEVMSRDYWAVVAEIEYPGHYRNVESVLVWRTELEEVHIVPVELGNDTQKAPGYTRSAASEWGDAVVRELVGIVIVEPKNHAHTCLSAVQRHQKWSWMTSHWTKHQGWSCIGVDGMAERFCFQQEAEGKKMH
jgi:hypothetical protein